MSQRETEFRYAGLTISPVTGEVQGHYQVGGHEFVETWEFQPGDFEQEATKHAIRYLYLFAGVSYYKTHAPLVVDLGQTPMLPLDRELLRSYYLEGLGEFCFKNELDLSGLVITGGHDVQLVGEQPAPPEKLRPLVCFGGGMDSLVSTQLLRGQAEVSLFVVSRPGDRVPAIEGSLERADLPVARATRKLDAKVLASNEHGFLNGHVPVTGIISAMALVSATLGGHDAVVMSNERSSSSPTRGEVNHQWSKSWDFELILAGALAQVPSMPNYFSLLRPWSELWIAQRFAELCGDYFTSFCSCNKAFLSDPQRRVSTWCTQCDKCAFLDLILAPYLSVEQLAEVFEGREPLRNPELRPHFLGLLTSGNKPWECVGDEAESRNALRLAAARDDRQDDELLAELVAATSDLAAPEVAELLAPQAPYAIPERYAPAARLS